MIFKVSWSDGKRKFTSLTKYTKTSIRSIYLGIKNNNPYLPLLLILPLKRSNEQKLFESRTKQNEMIDESEESNAIDYVKQMNQEEMNPEEEEELKQLYNKVTKEEMIVIFFKVIYSKLNNHNITKSTYI